MFFKIQIIEILSNIYLRLLDQRRNHDYLNLDNIHYIFWQLWIGKLCDYHYIASYSRMNDVFP